LTLCAPRLGAQRGKAHVVLIGIKTYLDEDTRRPWLKYADKDAISFAEYLTRKPARGVDLAVLTDQPDNLPATRTNIMNTLDRVLTKDAGELDDVYLFVSARGSADKNSNEGYLDAYDTQSQKRPNTAVLVSDLLRLIGQCHANHIYVFADVCREQRVGGLDNRINLSMNDLRSSGKPVELILASEPNRPSFEDDTLKHGVFGYALASGFGGVQYNGQTLTPTSTILDLFNYLMQQLAERTNSAQKPFPLPQRPRVPLFAPSLIGWLGSAFTHGPLVASAVPDWQDDRPQVAGVSPRVREFEDKLLAVDGDASDPLLRQVESQFSPEERFELATDLEDVGQMVVARYGIGDQFAGDPTQLQKSDFQRANRAFLAASRLRPTDDSLKARQNFCAGRLLLFDRNLFGPPGPLSTRPVLGRAVAALEESIRIDRDLSKRHQDPEHHQAPEAYNALGIAYLEQRDYAKAAQSFRDAIRRAPEWSYPRHNLALTLTEQGQTEAAEREYRAAISHTPYYSYLYYNLGLLLHRANRLSAAATEYGLALRYLDIQFAALLERKGIWLADGKKDEGGNADRRATSLKRNRAQILNALGVLKEEQRREKDAIAQYLEALKSDPSLLAAQHNLALLYRDSNPGEAIRLWEDLLTQDTSQQAARMQLANTYASNRDFANATKQFELILNQQPDNFEARRGLANSLAAAGDYVAAIREMQRSIEQRRAALGVASDSGDYEQTGDWYSKLGQTPDACAQYRLAEIRGKGTDYKPKIPTLKQKLKVCGTGG
jgi:tetratricopeptide (TPR) repeat protein